MRKGLRVFVAMMLSLICAVCGCQGNTNDTGSKNKDTNVDRSDIPIINVSFDENSHTCSPTSTPIPVTDTPEVFATEIDTPTPTGTPKPSMGTVYLTFDDGPVTDTELILDILNEYGIKATFFTVGKFVEFHPDITKRIVEEGHVLACHTYSHDFDVVYVSPESFMADINKWRRAVNDAVGYDAGAYVVRFPGGSNNATIGSDSERQRYMNALHYSGYYAFDWTVGLNDKWLGGNTKGLPLIEYLRESYLSTMNIYSNSGKPMIVIIHDTVPESIELLPWVIEDLQNRGYSFGTLDQRSEDYLMKFH